MKKAIIVVLLLLFSMIVFVPSGSAWYNVSWNYRKTITITNPVAGYQMRLNVTYDADMQVDFDDLRFIDSDDTTVLDYWIEYKSNSNYAICWVELLDAGNTIYMYYGNAGAAAISSGANTWNYYINWATDYSATFTSITSTYYAGRWLSLPQAFTSGAGYRMLFYQWDSAHVVVNQYDTEAFMGLMNDTAETLGTSSECIGQYIRIDTDGTPDQSHGLVTKNDGTRTETNVYDYLATVNDAETYDLKVNATAITTTVYATQSGSSVLTTHTGTVNIANGNLDVLEYGADGGGGGCNLYWTWIDADDAIEYGPDSTGGRCDFKFRQQWLCIGKYVSTEPTGSFGAEQVSNLPPEFSDEIPTDGSTTTNLPCVLYINITDAEGDMFNYSWGCSDGSSNLASGNTNGTKIFMLNHCTECGHQYTWWVNASEYNNDSVYTNESFNFVTRPCGGEYSEIYPANNSAGICPCSDCDNYTCVCINATLEGGGTVNISFYSNYSGAWIVFDKLVNVSGYYCSFFPAEYETQYWWYVNVTEFNNKSNYNQTDVFTFTTDSYINCTNCTGGGNVSKGMAYEYYPGIGLITAFAIMFFFAGYLVREGNKKKKKEQEVEKNE